MRRAGCDHTEGDHHDCDYVERRNSKVLAAAEIADRQCPRPDGPPHREWDAHEEGVAELNAWAPRWNDAFHAAMENLMKMPAGFA